MKRRILMIIVVAFLLLVGACVLFYPSISTWINERNQSRAIQTYVELVEELDSQALETQWALAQQYNQTFMSQSGEGLDRSISAGYEDILNLDGSGVMGYIEIPVLGVHLPVYHGTGEKALQRGAGHIPETPLPIGGEGCHAVLTGHRASATADLFTELDMLAENDIFLLHILDTTLAYQVDQITVVEPANIQDLLPVAGKDYVTLVTCTPYAVNSHRLLVRGTRIPYDPEASNKIREIEHDTVDWQVVIVLAFLLFWVVILLILFVTRKGKGRPGGKKGRWKFAVVACFLMLTGILVILYPTISNLIYRREAEHVIQEFIETQSLLRDMDVDTDLLLERIQAYNLWLYEAGQEEGLQNPNAFEKENTALLELGYENEMIGYIDIPKMEIALPIYMGADQDNLNRGAAHMTYTSIPASGENTHVCIIGHRNLTRTEMFHNIDRLEEGDAVTVHTSWEQLEYIVVETKIIWPSETDYLLIQPDRELLTLVSCYPRGSNEQRYLVICERIF